MRRSGLRCALAAAAVLLTAPTSHAADPCPSPLARVVSVQGTVDMRRAGADWQPATLDAGLCAGDTVRVQQRSRAALALSNETTLRLDQGTTLTLVAPDDRNSTWLEQAGGAVHVITRTPKPFRVKTPFVNASVEGTEFMVRVLADRATVSVYEGTVVAANEIGSVSVSSGEEAIAQRGAAPRKDIHVRPADAVAWTLYVPAVLDDRPAAPGDVSAAATAQRRSAVLYRSGRLSEALQALDQVPEAETTPKLLAWRAGLLLLVGRSDEARPILGRALQSADAHSLLAVLAVAENDRDLALQMAEKAVSLDAASPAAWLALSYAWQARFDLAQAIAAAQRATEVDPGHALAWSRLAELRMAHGELDLALAAAQRAVALDPDLAKTHTVFGYANLARQDTRAAKASFERAIVLDQGDPLPRFGLGLARIREGDLAAGRTEIEIATSLDPSNWLIRSYLGKAYYEEKRGALAAGQFALAKKGDPHDPTPWFYDAVRKQSENRPVDALLDLDRSMALNDNRAVYRAHSLIEDDSASRFATAAAIYRELGFDKWAIAESAKALTQNPANAAVHQELAAAYSRLPKHDIARVSESLQAQLRAPVASTPVPLQLSTDNLVILRESGPTRLGANEFNQLFARDRVSVLLDLVGGNRGTWGDQFQFNGVFDQTALSLAQLHYKTDGFDDNGRTEKNIYSLQARQQLGIGSTIQLELKRSELDTGETLSSFSPDDAFPLRIRETTDLARVGGHLVGGSHSDTIWSVATESRERTIGTADFVLNNDTARTRVAEIQHLRTLRHAYLLFGLAGTQSRDSFFDGNTITTRSNVAYVYGNWIARPQSLSVQGGAAFESFNQELSALVPQIKRRRLSPKLGVVWLPQERTTVRAAFFESVKRPLVGSQTLEPTQVSGFNQFFTGFDNFYGDPDGTISRRTSVAIDQKLSPLGYAGAEVASRRMAVPSLILERDVTWQEDTARLYLYKAIGGRSQTPEALRRWQFALSAEYETELIRRPQVLTGVEGIVNLRTDRLPLAVKAFSGNGWSIGARTSFVRQRGDFSIGPALPTFAKHDSAWLTDLSIEYKLGRRLGVVSLGVQNIFDKAIDVIETDPVNPTVAKRRFVTAKARLVF